MRDDCKKEIEIKEKNCKGANDESIGKENALMPKKQEGGGNLKDEQREVVCERSLGEMEIEQFFYGNSFNLFVSYCKGHGLIRICDLYDFDFQKLAGLRGMGIGKIKKITEKYNLIVSEKYVVKPKCETVFFGINKEMSDVNIDVLVCFGISISTINTLKKAGYTIIGDMEGIGEQKLSEIVGKRNIYRFKSVAEKLHLTNKKLLSYVLKDDRGSESYQIFLMRAKGSTLQEIADGIGLTRERVRQKINKYNRKLSPMTNQIVKSILKHKKYIEPHDLFDTHEDEFEKVVLLSCELNEEIEYLDFADIFVPMRKDGEKAEDIILALAIEFIGEGINISNNLVEMEAYMSENGFEYMGFDEFMNLIQKYGYKIYGDYITKGAKSYGFLCAKVVEDEFPEGIKLHEGEDLSKLRELAGEYYGDLKLPDGDRALSARMYDYLVLCGKGAAIAPKNICIPLSLVEEIKEYIDNRAETNIYYSEIFARFEGVLMANSNINNHHFLHGVLMVYYPEEYNYYKDYLEKHGGSCSVEKLNKRIERYINEQGRPVSKRELKIKFRGISDSMLFRAIDEDDELFQWEYNYYSSAEILKIDQESKQILYIEICEIMSSNFGYCSEMLLFSKSNGKIQRFLEINSIKKAINLFYVCSYLFREEFDFRRPHIVKKNLFGEITTKTVAMNMLGNSREIFYSEYAKIAKKLMWSEVTTSLVFSQIESQCLRVSIDGYVLDWLDLVPNKVVEKIEEVVIDNMQDNIFPIINFEDWEKLPDIGYKWNSFLLHSLIEKMGKKLKVVGTKITDRRYERGIIVFADSGIKEYADVISFLFVKKEIHEISESQMLLFLTINGLTYKTIPRELYHSESFEYRSEKFFIMNF